MIRWFLAAGLLLVLAAAPPALHAPAWEADTRVVQDTSGAGQHETALAVNPRNPDNAVVVFKDYRAAEHNYLDTTTDGGATWHEQPFADLGPPVSGNTDPSVYFRRDGRAYILWTGIVDWPDAGLYCAWSDDGGFTWSTPVAITAPAGHYDDKSWLAFDATGGPYDGTIDVAWTRFGLAEIDAARSTDGGATWSAAVQISDDPWTSNDDGAQPLVLPGGAVIDIFLHDNPDGTATLVRTGSTDGGVTWSPDTPLFAIQPPPYTLPGEHWRLVTYHSLTRDPVRGWLTLVWGDYANAAANGVDILTSRSTDDGASWTPPARLNDDPPGVVRDQWFPVVAAAPDGRLTALWLDRRDDPANVDYAAYTRTSLDGGLTWAPSERISSAFSNPGVNIPPGSDGIGDYIGLTAGPGVVWGAWVDTRNGDQDIYAARQRFSPLPPPSSTAVPPPATRTPVASSTAPPSSTPLATNTVTATPSPTATSGPSATPCAVGFTDVQPADYFYTPVRDLACRGAIAGYTDGTFRPYNATTRSQLVKIVVLGYGTPLVTPAGGAYTFADVPPANPFFAVIETAAAHNVVSGYTCGSPGEPCDTARRPYFRPSANVTRGQLAKIDVVAAGWALISPATGSFADVLPGTAFYPFVETAAGHGIISGYACGSAGEPCDSQNRPYVRPAQPATRGQIAKIVDLSLGGDGTAP
ncbi:MAG TPA: S-layer homology domain-containing protein [Chloroflexia bacterium]|nr:S-layer homology domain-containing protein [Chloroflexia bacterium]